MVFALLTAGAALLGAAGLAKIMDPAPAGQAVRSARLPVIRHAKSAYVNSAIRLLGLVEFSIAAASVVVGGRLTAGLLAVAYLTLALGAGRLLVVGPDADCGCFGRTGATISVWHVLVNCGFAVVGLVGVATPSSTLRIELSHQPLFGIPVVVASLLLAWLCYLMIAALPELQVARNRIGATQ